MLNYGQVADRDGSSFSRGPVSVHVRAPPGSGVALVWLLVWLNPGGRVCIPLPLPVPVPVLIPVQCLYV